MEIPYRTCLLIDDNPLDNFITSKVLKRSHFAENVIVSEQPDIALSLLKEGKVRPDVIFLDINMPKMDGFEFLMLCDKLEINKANTRIFVLSSSVRPADITRAESNKYVEKFISKSLTPEILFQLTT